MSNDAPTNTNRVRAARTLLVVDLVFALVVCGLGIRAVLDPPTTLCGRAQPSFRDACVVVAAVSPLALLGIRLLRRPTQVRYQTVLATVAIVALTLLAIWFPAGFSFQNGFCIAPF
jgi:hypothetical protein